MEKNLSVPYYSQHGSDSVISNDDCGAASLAMCLSFFNVKKNTGDVLKELGNPRGYISFAELKALALKYKFNSAAVTNATWDHIKGYLDQNIPVIVVGGNQYLKSAQDQNFKGSHIMVVVGYRDDGSVYVNDPNFWGPLVDHGNHHVYTKEEFANFWQNSGNKEGNQANTLLAITPQTPVVQTTTPNLPKQVVVTSTLSLRGRSTPNINQTNIIVSYKQDTVLNVVSSAEGDNVEGNNLWYLVENTPANVFVWSGAVTAVSKPSEPQEAPKPEKESPTPAASPALPEVETPKPEPTTNVVPVSPSDAIKQMQAMYQISKDYLIEHNALPVGELDTKKSGFWDKVKEALHIN